MTAMLASVTSPDEAALVLHAGVDLIDLKQPAQGALGALGIGLVAQIVKQIQNKRPVSATIGDLPLQPDTVFNAVRAMSATGVDYVKIGFFPGGDISATIDKLTALTAEGIKIIAVLFADTNPEAEIITSLAQAGFSGVMLDTMDKQKGSLTGIMTTADLQRFVALARQHHMLCGLAGSLTLQDIPNLLTLRPDYLGFRGALCNKHQRTARLSQAEVLKVKAALHANVSKTNLSLLNEYA